MNILLVEDNEGDIELTTRAFKKGSPLSALSVAHDGAEAMEFLSRQGKFGDAAKPDLILLDINMPRMDGRRFLEIVKQDEKLKSIPVIMMTSSSAPRDIQDCYERHANCYILKPFDAGKYVEMARQIESFWVGIVQLPTREQLPELPAA